MNRAVILATSVLAFAASAAAGETPRPEAPVSDVPRPHVDATHRALDPQHADAQHRPADPPRARTCFTSAETREKIVSRRLSEPFRLVRGAAGRLQGEALRAKLCRYNDDYVYEIAVLRRDGHIVHVYLNAMNGQTVGAFNDR